MSGLGPMPISVPLHYSARKEEVWSYLNLDVAQMYYMIFKVKLKTLFTLSN